MKIKAILAVTLAAMVTLASCSKDEGNDKVTGDNAKLTIGVSAPAGSRAAGELTDNSDNTIAEFKAYVFAGEVLQAIMTSATGAEVTEATKVTTAANAIYVIANANSATALSGVAEGTTTKTAFLALAGNLISSNAFAAISAGGKVWASGYVAPSFDANNEASESVSVVPMSARINVKVTDNRTKTSDPAAYVITGVQMRNVAGTARFIAPGSFVAPTVWYNGVAGDNTGATVTTYFNDTYSTTGNYFYAFENNASTHNTIVTLVTENDENKVRYYPVHFNTDDAGYAIERGTSYQVAITLTGDATDDTGITTPEEPIVTATLAVSVSPTVWTMVPISKEF